MSANISSGKLKEVHEGRPASRWEDGEEAKG